MSRRALLPHLLSLLLCLAAAAPARAQGPHPEPSEAARSGAPLVPTPRPVIVAGEVHSPRFRVLYTARAEGPARELLPRLEEMRTRFGQLLGRDWRGAVEVRVGRGRAELEALALPGGAPPRWAVALAYPAHGIILLDAEKLAGPEGPTTLRHELAHVALGQLAPGWPRWFQEGLAMNLTGERLSLTQYATLYRGVHTERVFRLEDLDTGWPDRASDVELAYAQSADFVAHLAGRYPPARFAALADGLNLGEPFETAFAKAFQTSLGLEEKAWLDGLPLRFGWMPVTLLSQLLWSGAALVLVVGWALRRRQRLRRREEMLREEAAEDAALALLQAEADAAAEPPPAPAALDAPDAEPPAAKPTLH